MCSIGYGKDNMFKHVIPTQRYGEITVECTHANVETNYYMLKITFEDFSDLSIKLTLHTLEQILDRANQIKSLYKENEK